MIWDLMSGPYDLFENIYNGKVYKGLGERVAREIEKKDIVLECACGTGAITKRIATNCKKLLATDLSTGMLKRVKKKCRGFNNVTIKRADIMNLGFKDGCFDKVVAGNVIHLLDDPQAAIKELVRVCKKGGKVIIPTYINIQNGKERTMVKFIELLGVNFKKEFYFESYKQFFKDAGYENVAFDVIEGKMPCAVAIITKE